jgi:hypothetical protein
VGRTVSVIKTAKAWITVLSSYLVTRYDFTDAALEVRVCRLFRIRLPYGKIRCCCTKLSYQRIVIFGRLQEETCVRRIIVWRTDGVVIGNVFRVDDFKLFLEEIRERAPQAEIRALKSNRATITAARKAGFPWLIFMLRREKFDGMNAPTERVSVT